MAKANKSNHPSSSSDRSLSMTPPPGVTPSNRSPRGPRGGHPGMGAMMPAEKPRDFRGTLRRLLKVLRPHRLILAFALLMSVFTTIFLIVSPKILGQAMDIIADAVRARIDTGKGQIDFEGLLRILLIVGVIYCISSFFTWLTHYMMAGISQKIAYTMRQSIDKKLTYLPLSYYDSTPRGEIISRVSNDMDNIAMTLQQGLTQMITSVTTIAGILIMMLTISPILTLVSLIMLPLAAITTALIARKSQKYFSDMWASTGRLNGHVEEMYTGQTIVRLFNRQKQSGEIFDRENAKLFKSSFKAQFVSGIVMPAMRLIENINYVIICVVGGLGIINGTLTLGGVTAFITYSKQFTQPITQTASIINTMQSTIASAERVFDLLDAPEETPEKTLVEDLPEVRGEIRFEDVCFRYKEDVPLIENMNLHVMPGQTVAIVGPTGAGKTTLVNLLMRFYDIRSGRILMDGNDITDMPRDTLRKNFGMVLQDTWLFSGTIRDNIAYGVSTPSPVSDPNPDKHDRNSFNPKIDPENVENAPSTEDILQASRAAYVDHFVRTFPDGYDTVLTDQGENLSQGQRQLLTIARAFLADPKILILDEATSSVDTRTELMIQKAMNKLMTGRTSFVIAHRLSTIREADVILVMDQGKIVEQGTHDSLLAADGFYAELYHSQFRSGVGEAV